MKKSISLSRRLNAVTAELDVSDSGHTMRTCFPVSAATTAAERLEAARLVSRAYIHEGYIEQSAETPFLAIHHLLKETTVFVVKDGLRIVGTLAVVLDSRAGLPMEDLYGDEVRTLRESGRRVCEMCSLAVDLESGRQYFGLVLDLFRAAGTYAFCMADVDDLCLTIKPSHARFYSRLACEELGGFKLDERFAFAETLGLRLRRESIEPHCRPDPFSPPLARAINALSLDEQTRIRNEIIMGATAASDVVLSVAHLSDILARATELQVEYLWETQNRRRQQAKPAALVSTSLASCH